MLPRLLTTALAATVMSGCTALTPQLPPTDFAELEQLDDRHEREVAYAENQVYVHHLPQGERYTKGTELGTQQRSWQSLDAILRSSQHSSAALPYRQQRLSRLFTALTIVASIVTVAGAAASAREGLNLGELNGTGALLLGGGLATVGFGITAGIFYGKTRRGYENAVDLYNDSLGMRLGILDGDGEFIPAPGTILDADGYVVLDPTADDVAQPTQPGGGSGDEASAAPPKADGPPAGVSPTGAQAEPVDDPDAPSPPDPDNEAEADPQSDPAADPAPDKPAEVVPPPSVPPPSVAQLRLLR